MQKAKLGQAEEMAALRRLDRQARILEAVASGPSWDKVVADELDRSSEYGGRSVFGWEKPCAAPPIEAHSR
jgi:hypothetical protein